MTVDTLNAGIRNCRYEVRGEVYLAAVERVKSGKDVIYTNIGNPHALGQQPITFTRQVLALVTAPFLLKHPLVNEIFPSDVIARAKLYLSQMEGGMGAYSHSKGTPFIRQEVANFISTKHNVESNPENIILGNGASEIVRVILQAVITGPKDGIMVPIPQYPLYSAAIAFCGGEMVPYYLDEDNRWSLNINELQKRYDEAVSRGIRMRALVYINPGNPTGQCLTEGNVQELIQFCFKNRIVLCADEVYQDNIYQSKSPFVSARAELAKMPEPYRSGLELITFHSISKGFSGECGLRGGFMELHNMDPEVMNELYKVISINLSPNMHGQIAVGLMVNPPKPGDASYPLYAQERDNILNSFRRRAKKLTQAFNAMEGVFCDECDGALYVFPRITLPPAAIEAARKMGKEADVLYCLELLQETGITCVPGSGFKQLPGTFHIRTTILVLHHITS